MRYHKITPYLFILPMLVGLVLFRFGPILASFLISFTEWRGTRNPVYLGLGNYAELLNSDVFWEVLNNTFLFAGLFVPGTMFLGLLLALLANQPLKGIAFFRGVYYLPAITSMVAVALVWNWIFASRFGILNHVLRTYADIADPPRWLSDSSTALYVLVIVSIWKSAGLPMMVYLAGLKGIPRHLYESAKIDGANTWQMFRHITLPVLTPVTFFILIITLFDAFGTFEVTFAMTQGGPLNSSTTLPFYIYQNSFQFARYGLSSSLAYVLMIVVVILTAINFYARDRWVQQELY
ncbi:MAG: sugar ABC transporter permease [Chloroflexota bacterium]